MSPADPEPSLLPDAVAEAVVEAARGQRIADAAELFVRCTQDCASSYEPLVGRWTRSAGVIRTITARLWRGATQACATLPLEDVGSVAAVLARAARLEWAPASPPPPAPVHTAVPTRLEQATHDEPRVEALAAHLMRLGPVQALVGHATRERMLLAADRGDRVERERAVHSLLVRCETKRGAVVDGVEGANPPLPLSLLEERLADALATLGADGAGPPEPGLPWVLGPAVAATLALGLSWTLRGDLAARNPKMAALVGKRLLPACLTVRDPASTASPAVDEESQAAEAVTLFERGVLQTFLHTHESATKLGVASTGRAWRDVTGEPRPQAHALQLAPGDARMPPDHNALTVRTEMFNPMPRAGRVMISVAGWVVRAGLKVRAITPFELELPVLEVLRRVEAVGADVGHFPALENCGSPSLLVPPLGEFAVHR